MLLNALHGKPLPVDGDGQNIRDWLYAEDHCRAVERVLEAARLGESYNVGGGDEWTNLEIVRLLCRLADEAFAADSSLCARLPNEPAARGASATLIDFVPDRAGHDRRYATDSSEIQSEPGFHPKESFETGIRRTVAWYLAHEAWWRGMLERSHPA
jgi:dTDP-glucose 4,6-dehydratase